MRTSWTCPALAMYFQFTIQRGASVAAQHRSLATAPFSYYGCAISFQPSMHPLEELKFTPIIRIGCPQDWNFS